MTVKEQRRIETATCFKQRRRKIKYKVMLEFTVQRHHIVEAETPEEAEDLALYGEGYIDHDEDWSYNNYSDIEESEEEDE